MAAMRMLAVLVAVWVVSCGGRPIDPPRVPVEPVVMTATPATRVVVKSPIVAPAKRAYRIGIESVELTRTTAVHAAPRSDAFVLGIITKTTRAGVIDAVDPIAGDPCRERWIAIAPRGWVCESFVEPSEAAPTTAFVASFDDEDTTPIHGVYGLVRGANPTAYASSSEVVDGGGRALAGSNTVRAVGTATIDGRRFWRTTQGELIDEASIVQLSPSRFKGVAITGGALPAWVRSHRDAGKPIKTYATPHGAINGELAARAVVMPQEVSDGFVRVTETAWVDRRDLRIATLATPPEGTGADEKWFDIDRDEQVLVAYEGTTPVYATLVSTGKYQHETPTSIARVASKLEHAVMSSEKESVYSVADVPWTMYYDRDFALHTSYWHDGFGSPRSHGCVNLAPRDALVLYRWSSPDVPPGWTAVYGDVDHPGSLVRVRSLRDPEPAFRGYARDLRDRVASR